MERIACALEAQVRLTMIALEHEGVGQFSIASRPEGAPDESALFYVDDGAAVESEQKREAFFEAHGRYPREGEE